QPLPVGDLGIEETTRHANTSVVDETKSRTKLALDLLREALNLRSYAHIDGRAQRLHAQRAALGERSSEPDLVGVATGNFRSGASELERSGATNAFRCAGDDRHAPAEVNTPQAQSLPS